MIKDKNICPKKRRKYRLKFDAVIIADERTKEVNIDDLEIGIMDALLAHDCYIDDVLQIAEGFVFQIDDCFASDEGKEG